MGKLFVVATPLGNLQDISFRAISTLKSVDVVLCEDSRQARKILDAYDISAPLSVYHQHISNAGRLKILEELRSGKNLALITDAGTPGISDPGNELISFLLEFEPHLEILPIPGASSLTTLLSVCGFPTQSFTFIGFFPRKKQTKILEQIQSLDHPVVFFESPHRIVKTLSLLRQHLGEDTNIVVGRELTKIHETIYRGTIKTVHEMLVQSSTIKGEIVVVLAPNRGVNIPS